jgi:protein-tyrosine-phosphatase
MKTHIHFVCTGNAYRSRLAEGYLRSLKIPKIIASSSGTQASIHRKHNGPICWYALRIAVKQGFPEFISHRSIQTTEKIISRVNYLIFMHPDNQNQFMNLFNRLPEKFQTWDIPDLHHLGFTGGSLTSGKEPDLIKATEETFVKIKQKVDKMVTELQSA